MSLIAQTYVRSESDIDYEGFASRRSSKSTHSLCPGGRACGAVGTDADCPGCNRLVHDTGRGGDLSQGLAVRHPGCVPLSSPQIEFPPPSRPLDAVGGPHGRTTRFPLRHLPLMSRGGPGFNSNGGFEPGGKLPGSLRSAVCPVGCLPSLPPPIGAPRRRGRPGRRAPASATGGKRALPGLQVRWNIRGGWERGDERWRQSKCFWERR